MIEQRENDMSKRFTCTDKWKKNFIKNLPAKYKLLWFYILDDCDHAGIWHTDFEVASIRIGEPVTVQESLKYFGDKIIIIDSGEKWYIPAFIDFQYGELNPENRVHKSILTILNKYKIKPLTSPLQGAKDKDKDMDKDKDKNKEGKFEEVWQKYPRKDGRKDALKHYIASVKTEKDFIDINTAVNNYANYVIKHKTEYDYIKTGKVFFNNWRDWINQTGEKPKIKIIDLGRE